MKKFIFTIGVVLLLLSISGCKEDEPDPTDTMNAYIDSWNNENFNKMYSILSDESKSNYAKKDFVDRYKKIYDDLNINKLKIDTSTTLSEEQLKKTNEEGKATFSVNIALESMAGPINYERDMTLILTKNEKDEKQALEWKINWDEGFILPGLEDGGKISIEREKPRRGEILDRNQMPLAINDTAYEIGVVPNQMQNEASEKEQIAKLLHMSVDQIDEQLEASWVQPDYFVPLKTIPQSAESQLAQLLDIPSVTTKETIGRAYPSGPASAHLTGYIGKITAEELEEYPEGIYSENDMVGKRGLEKLYEEQLHGEEGVKILLTKENENDTTEKNIIVEKPVKNGEHIQVSIDVNIQEKIFHAYGDHSGTSAAVQPKTGEVLALVSSPSFDPNELTYGITQSRWDQLMEDENKPFINRFSSTYAPGSVIKPVTAAIGLSNGTITHDKGLTINGLTWGKEKWGDVKVTRVSTSEGPVTLKGALVRSDNIYFAMQGVEMGSKAFIDGMKSFGLGEKIPLEYPIESSQISNDGKLDEILLANTSYGQGQIEMSSLHMALAYTTFLNEGNMIKPSFLHDDKKGEIWKENLINKEDADKIQGYLSDVVTEGTAKSAKDKDLAISGKTGTAELKVSKDADGHQNGWFIGYPTKDQDILIAMMMEKVEDVGSSSYVAGKVKDVLKEIKK